MRTITEADYRDYQIEARDLAFAEFAKGISSTLIVASTGCGKTVLAGMCIEQGIEKLGKPALFIAHREVLIQQAYKTMQYFDLDTAIEMGESDAQEHIANFGNPQVVVGSVQTLQDARLMRWARDYFGLIIIDECHRSLSDSYTKILNWFTDYRLIGITATPKRGDERNLGSRFQTRAFEYHLREAITEGWLVPIRTRTCASNVNLRGVKLSGGDFSVGELEERIGPELERLGRSVIKEIGKRPTVAFLPDVGSAMAFAGVLAELGVPSRYVAGTGGRFGMPKAERKENLADFAAGVFQVITCNELLVEGWDAPNVEAVCILRPTLQQYRYTQMVGRGTRLSPDTGKKDCLVVDFDWEADDDCKDLCSTIELFDDGSVDDGVFPIARQLAAERAVDVDPMEVIAEAEKILRTRQKFRVKLTGKEDTYRSWEHDPVGVSKILAIKLSSKYDLNKRGNNPPTDAQVGLLRHLGVEAPEGLSKWGASKMLKNLIKRRENGESSAKQVQTLMVGGVDAGLARSMSFNQAKAAIIEIDANNIKQPKTQLTMFS